MQNMNPMNLLQQLNQFRAGINGNPEEIVKKMVSSGQVSQAELNQAQQVAKQLQDMLKL